MIEAVRTLAGLYEVNTGLLVRSMEGLSREEVLHRPGDSGNSMLWIAGHLVTYRHVICKYLGTDIQQSLADLFRRGEKFDPLAAYPEIEELLGHWNTVSAALSSAFEDVTEARLKTPTERSFPGVSQTVRGAVSFLHFHESYHVGQLAYIRRLLGHSQLVG